jgi:hypothetical protein
MSVKLSALALAAIFTATLLIIAYARGRPAFPVISNENGTIETQESTPNRVEAEMLVLGSNGFQPKEITRPAGRFLLAVQNHSSEEEISLVLKQESGASARDIRMSKRQSKLKDVLQLPPGRYVLVETNHPEWSCTITITSR